MAKIDVKATVTAPAEVTIPLVRADHHETSNIFRVCFEVFMSLFSGLLGYVLSLKNPEAIHFVSLTICGLAALVFLIITFIYGRKSKNV